MKMFAIFDSGVPAISSKIAGQWHYLNLSSGHTMLVCEPRHYGKAEDHLTGLGAKVFPCVLEHVPIGAELAAHPAFAGSGIASTDTTIAAMKTLMKHFGWPQLEPRKV